MDLTIHKQELSISVDVYRYREGMNYVKHFLFSNFKMMKVDGNWMLAFTVCEHNLKILVCPLA